MATYLSFTAQSQRPVPLSVATLETQKSSNLIELIKIELLDDFLLICLIQPRLNRFIHNCIHGGVLDTRDRFKQAVSFFSDVNPNLRLGWLRHSFYVIRGDLHIIHISIFQI